MNHTQDLSRIIGELTPFADTDKQTQRQQRRAKTCASLTEAIRRSGLRDGMTISFHHAFRGGDLTLNLVMDQLAEEISRGLMAHPVQIHSHGGRAHLVKSGELNIDVAFLGVPSCDDMGNANGYTGSATCGSLGYAMVDAQYANQVILLTEDILPYPHHPASIRQDQVDLVVLVECVGDAEKIGADATRMTTNPRELQIAQNAALVIEASGYFREGFSLQTGTGGAALAVTRFLGEKMRRKNIRADFALGGITATIVGLHEEGYIRRLLDVQGFDSVAARSLARNPNHIEISANEYANFSSKGASVNKLDVVD